MLNICIFISAALIGLAQSGPLKRFENATSSLPPYISPGSTSLFPTGYGSTSTQPPSTRSIAYGTSATASTSGRVTTLTMYTTIPPGADDSFTSSRSALVSHSSSSIAASFASPLTSSTLSTLSRSFVYAPLSTAAPPSSHPIHSPPSSSSTQRQPQYTFDGPTGSSGMERSSSSAASAFMSTSTFSSTASSRIDASSSSSPAFNYPYPASSSSSSSKSVSSSSNLPDTAVTLQPTTSTSASASTSVSTSASTSTGPAAYRGQTSHALQSTSSVHAQSDGGSSQALPHVVGSSSSTLPVLGPSSTSASSAIPGITIQPIPASLIYTMTVTVTVTDPGKTTTVAEKTVTVSA